MPLFGLWDKIYNLDGTVIGRILDGMSKVLSMMTLMLMISASMIDLKWIQWNKC